MGLNDRDYMRENGNRAQSKWRMLFLSGPVRVVVFVLVGLFALQTVSRRLFRVNSDAVARVMSRDQVGWAAIGWDGVRPAEQAALGVPCALKVTEVARGGPAAKGGMIVGDLIVGINEKPFSDVHELQGNARSFQPGQIITIEVNRAGMPLSLSIKLGSWAEIEKLEISGVAL